MSIKATFPSGATQLTVNGLHQWDYGQKLEIHADDLPALVEVHFACAGMKEAIVRSCAVVTGVAEAAIPDRCLEQETPITAWIYEVGETAGATVKTITLIVTPRARPQPSETVPEVIADKYTELVGEVNKQVEALKAGNVKVSNAANADRAASSNSAEYATLAGEAALAEKARADGDGNDIRQTYWKRSEQVDRATTAVTAERAINAASATMDGRNNNIVDTYQTKAGMAGHLLSKRWTVSAAVEGSGMDYKLPLGELPAGLTLTEVSSIIFTSTNLGTGREICFYGIPSELYYNPDGSTTLKMQCIFMPYTYLGSYYTGGVTICLRVIDGFVYLYHNGSDGTILQRVTVEGSLNFALMATEFTALIGETLNEVEVIFRKV